MTAQDRPFVSLAAGDDFCARGKCLRKCVRRNKPDHYHNALYGEPCHDGECWPKRECACTDQQPSARSNRCVTCGEEIT